MKAGHDYMVQPLSMGETLVGTPYALVEGTEDGKVMLKVTNLGDEEVVLKNQDCIATINEEDWATDCRPGRAFDTTKKKADIDLSHMVSKDLDQNKKTQLVDLLQKYNSVFYTGGKLPVVNVGIEHTIRLKENSTPTVFKPRRLSKELSDEVHDHIEKLLKMGVIRESNSIWASPVVCARRADGTLRLVIDYRMANTQSLTATLHPLPVIDDLIDRLGNAKYFATIDAKSGYHQMPLKKEDSDITAFVVPWGHYEFSERTPFGLKGAGYSFQRMMSAILGKSNYEEALCYLDDILVWGETWEIFMKRLRKVMEKISKSGLALSADKCKFGMKEVSYLGCTIKHGMMSIKEQRVQQLRNIARPDSVRELRRALGAFAYVQRWLPGLAEVYKSLYEAVGGKPYERLKWTNQMISDFEKIKQMIADAVALALPDLGRRFILVTDCSDNGAGAMLAQESKTIKGFLQPVSFFHHALSANEQRYTATEKELLAVVLAVKKYRIYLGRDFDLITDHEALQWLKSLNPEDEIGRRGRWFDLLQQFSMNIIPKKGKSPEMTMADFMSRVKSDGSCKREPGDDQDESDRIMVISSSMGDSQEEIKLSKDVIIKAQAEDPEISLVKSAIINGHDLNPGRSNSDNWRVESMTVDNTTADIWKHKSRLFVDDDNILRIKWNGGRRNNANPNGVKVMNRIIVPESCKNMVLKHLHSSASAAHMGIDRTWMRARNNFWWLNMRQDIADYVSKCEMCGQNKHVNHPNKAPPGVVGLPEDTLLEIITDFIGPFQEARSHRFRYVLQIQDVLSRFLVFVPTVSNTAKTAADALMERWLCLFGMPKTIRSDRGRHFTAEVFEELCKMLNIDHKMGSPEHPESQGQVERQNQLVNQVRCLCDNDPERWPGTLSKVQLSHNASVNDGSGFTPSKMILGKTIQLPDDLVCKEKPESALTSIKDRVEQDEEDRLVCINKAKENITNSRNKRNESLMEKINGEPYKVGDHVRYKLNDDVRGKMGGKIAPRYSEAYKVIEVFPNQFTYTIEPVSETSRGRPKQRHFNELKTAERVELEETVSVSNNANDSESEVQPQDNAVNPITTEDTQLRRSGRERKQTKFLQIRGAEKQYTSETARSQN